MTAASAPPDASGADFRLVPTDAHPLTQAQDDDDPYGWVGYESAQPHARAAEDTAADVAASLPAGAR